MDLIILILETKKSQTNIKHWLLRFMAVWTKLAFIPFQHCTARYFCIEICMCNAVVLSILFE